MMFGSYVPDGIGRLVYSGVNGAYIFEGYFDYGQATGFGRWLWSDGRFIQGNFKDFQLQDDKEKRETVYVFN